MNNDVQEAKRLLPLPQLMERLGYGDHAKKNARCPFHQPDIHPSFGIFERNGSWGFCCHACGAKGDEIDFVAFARGIDKQEALKEFLCMAGAPAKSKTPVPKLIETPKAIVTPRPLAKLLDAVCDALRRWVIFPIPEQATLIALWTLHTWLFEAFEYTAYLFVYSASARSGKTRVLEALELLVKNPEKAEGASAAALIRSGDEQNPPTFLLDEVDTIYSKKGDGEAENMRRFLNAGYKRGAKFLKCVGQGTDIGVKRFPAFCPKALAGIDRCLPHTVLDRSLPIELARQTRTERAERLRDREARAATAQLRAELEGLSQQADLIEGLRSARPTLPDELHDRAQDITEPLIAIADLAGGEWPQKARAALIKIYKSEECEDSDIGIKLLRDIRAIFDESGEDRLSTRYIISELVENADDAPWPIWFEDDRNGTLKKAGSSLARKLKRFKIKPEKLRFGDETLQGYRRSQFEMAWDRLLAVHSPSPENNGTNGTKGTQSSFTREDDVPSSVPSTRNVPLLSEPERNMEYEGKMRNVPSVLSVLSVPSNLGEEPDEPTARKSLRDLVATIQSEPGLHPKGHPDCFWAAQRGGQYYPAEYTGAVNYLEHGNADEQRAINNLARLVFKMEVEARKGVPLVSSKGDWVEGNFPPEFEAARAFVHEQRQREERELLVA